MQSLTQLKNALLSELEAHKAAVLAVPENLEEYVNHAAPESVLELGQLALSEPDIRLFGGEAADAVEEMFQAAGCSMFLISCGNRYYTSCVQGRGPGWPPPRKERPPMKCRDCEAPTEIISRQREGRVNHVQGPDSPRH